ncbi:hypothetical protein CSKR_108179 [Clonorchis sinensis]|uniref:Uncharacterized protein n=1 Tax=Clonorchis sinensis TaxID=79923 RepID=A0A419PFT2_CLOSI|nr:hypothetical protein CSKR_108179 [Clonorchis sinensis]
MRAQWSKRECTDRKIRGSNPTSVSRLLRLGLGNLAVLSPRTSFGWRGINRLPRTVLFAEPIEGWKRAREGQEMTWQQTTQVIPRQEQSKCRVRVRTTDLPNSKFALSPLNHLAHGGIPQSPSFCTTILPRYVYNLSLRRLPHLLHDDDREI